MTNGKSNVVSTILRAKNEMTKELSLVSKGLQKVRAVGEKAFDALGKGAKKALSAIVSPFAKISALIGAVAVPGSVIYGLNQARVELDEIAKTAARINITTAALSELQFVAGLTGVNTNTLSLGLQRMVRRVSEAAAGTGEAQKAIQELGLEARSLNQLRADEQFEAIADAMSKVENEADKLRLTTKIFDSEGARLLVTMKAGTKQIREWRQELRDMGGAFDEHGILRVEGFNDALLRLKTVGGVAFKRIMVELAPLLESMAKAATEFVKSGMDDFVEGVSLAIVGMAKAFLGFGRVLAKIGPELRKIFVDIKNFATVAVAYPAVFAALLEDKGFLGAAAAKLIESFTKVTSTLASGVSAAGAEAKAAIEEEAKALAGSLGGLERALDDVERKIGDFFSRKKRRDDGPTFLESLIPGGPDGTFAMISRSVAEQVDQIAAYEAAMVEGRKRAEEAGRKAREELQSPLSGFNQKLIINQVRAAYVEMDMSLRDAIGSAISAVGEWADKNKRAREAVSKAKKAAIENYRAIETVVFDVANTIEFSLGRALDSVIAGTFNAREAFRDLGREVLRTLAKIALNRAISGIFGGGQGGAPGLFQRIFAPAEDSTEVEAEAAKGHAFAGGRVLAKYAKGGVVSAPTYFPMRGGLGLMGEGSKPEGVLPLGRLRNGDLGVQFEGAGGGGGGTVINYNFYGPIQTFGPQNFRDHLANPENASVVYGLNQSVMRTRPGAR